MRLKNIHTFKIIRKTKTMNVPATRPRSSRRPPYFRNRLQKRHIRSISANKDFETGFPCCRVRSYILCKQGSYPLCFRIIDNRLRSRFRGPSIGCKLYRNAPDLLCASPDTSAIADEEAWRRYDFSYYLYFPPPNDTNGARYFFLELTIPFFLHAQT